MTKPTKAKKVAKKAKANGAKKSRTSVTGGRASMVSKSSSSTRSKTTKPMVLIVDDAPDNRDIYNDFLTFSGYRVAEATNGEEAVELATELLPDVILMDLSLPGMDGWEATRRIKKNDRTKHIPIVALTGHALEGHEKGAKDAGCDGFIAKPCPPDVLEAELRRMLEPKVTSRSTTKARAKTARVRAQ
jgi:two-component system, cell cycle response regulator DivK